MEYAHLYRKKLLPPLPSPKREPVHLQPPDLRVLLETSLQETASLKQDKIDLPKLVDVLYKKNVQYNQTLHQYKVAFQSIKRTVRRSQTEAKNMLSLIKEEEMEMKRAEALDKALWDDFHDEGMGDGEERVGSCLEECRQRVLQQKSEEIIIGILDSYQKRDEEEGEGDGDF